jgi:hypothetical protein
VVAGLRGGFQGKKEMIMTRKATALLSIVLSCAAASVFAAKPLQGDVEIEAASKLERNAGVWLDGQYVGSAKELDGRGRLVLVPGEHHLLFKLIGYEDVASTIMVEPGTRQQYRIAMTPAAGAKYPEKDRTARLRIEVTPEVAAVFINDAFAGRSERFGTRRGVRLSVGTYRVTIALPGYEAFNAELTLRAGQTYEIKTALAKGRLDDQARELTASTPAGAGR